MDQLEIVCTTLDGARKLEQYLASAYIHACSFEGYILDSPPSRENRTVLVLASKTGEPADPTTRRAYQIVRVSVYKNWGPLTSPQPRLCLVQQVA